MVLGGEAAPVTTLASLVLSLWFTKQNTPDRFAGASFRGDRWGNWRLGTQSSRRSPPSRSYCRRGCGQRGCPSPVLFGTSDELHGGNELKGIHCWDCCALRRAASSISTWETEMLAENRLLCVSYHFYGIVCAFLATYRCRWFLPCILDWGSHCSGREADCSLACGPQVPNHIGSIGEWDVVSHVTGGLPEMNVLEDELWYEWWKRDSSRKETSKGMVFWSFKGREGPLAIQLLMTMINLNRA